MTNIQNRPEKVTSERRTLNNLCSLAANRNQRGIDTSSIDSSNKRYKLDAKISRKIIIPAEHCRGRNYLGLLIGPGGSNNKALVARAGGQIRIHVRDRMESNPFVLLEGESTCVDKAELLINDLLKVSNRENADYEKSNQIIPQSAASNPLEREKVVRFSDTAVPKEQKEDEIISLYWEKTENCPTGWRSYSNENESQKQHNIDNKMTRKIIIPVDRNPEYDYVGLLIGSELSRIKAQVADEVGDVHVTVRGKGTNQCIDEPLHVSIEGGSSCVDKAEMLINDLLRTLEYQYLESNKMEQIVTNESNDVRFYSLIDRVNTLENVIGIRFESNEKLCNKVKCWEIEFFGNAQQGIMIERISALEKEIGQIYMQ